MEVTGEHSTRLFRQPAWLFILLGFAIAPASVELPSMLVVAAMDNGPFLNLFRDSEPIVFIGHGISLILGVPTFLVLEWRGMRRLKHYILSGLGVGGGVLILLTSVTIGQEAGGFFAGLVVVGGICGTVVSAAFWWIVFGGGAWRSGGEIAAVFD